LEHLAESGHSTSSLGIAEAQMLTAIRHMNLGDESRLSKDEISAAAKEVALTARLFAYTVTD
jgi:hypothetical protein